MTFISAGTSGIVSTGSSTGDVIYGTEYVLSGGTAISATVENGGFQEVGDDLSGGLSTTGPGGGDPGGVARGTLVESGGEQDVYFENGGVASGTVIFNSGTMLIIGTGSSTVAAATGTVVSNGGYLADGAFPGLVQGEGPTDGALVVNTTIDPGGFMTVVSGGIASHTTIAGDGTVAGEGELALLSGCSGIATVVKSAGGYFVSAGAVDIGAVVSTGGIEYVGDTLFAGDTGGMASATIVSSGGLLYAASGGVTTAATVLAGGAEKVELGGKAVKTAVFGNEIFASGGIDKKSTVEAGGVLKIKSGAVVTKKDIVLTGGKEKLVLGATLDDEIAISGGTVAIGAAVGANGTIAFAGGGKLDLASPSTFAGTIAGFGAGTEIELAGFNYTGSGSEQVSFVEAAGNAGGTLTLTSGSHAAALNLTGVYATTNFKLATDGAGGTFISFVSAGGGFATPAIGPQAAQLHQLVHAAASFGAKAGAGEFTAHATEERTETALAVVQR